MFLLIHKPTGPTSHDIVDQLRRITGIRKIGHAGTLDPFASGLLIVAVGRESTQEIDQFVKLDKEYIATVKLGAETDTYDRTGEINKTKEQENKRTIPNNKYQITNNQPPKLAQITSTVASFIGPQLQTPPMYSAKKIHGQKLYDLARQGKTVERQPAEIEIKELEILDYSYPILKLRVACTSGTYIRSLAHDLGQKLGCGAYLEKLERTKVGGFSLVNAVRPSELTAANWQDYSLKH
ncbi:MAG: tRNA pseudouridine(55) synthase TruB [Patescibacteria group bacterium]|jgi:tRNA pseudouridine55 synthase